MDGVVLVGVWDTMIEVAESAVTAGSSTRRCRFLRCHKTCPPPAQNLPPLTPIDRDEGFALKGSKAERAAPVF